MSEVNQETRGRTVERESRTSRIERENRRVDAEARRILGDGSDRAPRRMGAKDRLRRLERIGERDSMRHMPGFDARRAAEIESFEIRTNPRGFLRREQGRGLDAATERELRAALRKNERARRA